MSDNILIVDKPGLDDPLWTYILETRLKPYIPIVREWWDNVHDFSMVDTGIAEICADEISGLYVRFTRTAVRSPIRGVQAFPFVPTARLQITGIQGGSTKMVERVCLDGKFTIDEFTIICKNNLPSMFNAAQIIAFVPTEVFDGTKRLGTWIYFTIEECSIIAKGESNEAIRQKALLKA